MEKLENNFEKNDPWRDAILKEREISRISKTLKSVLDTFEGKYKNALILGDASLVQSKFFLDEINFEHVVNVDASPSIMDDEIVRIQDQRLERVQAKFDEYHFNEQKFDFIYGKSIGFNPKETVKELLENLSKSLTGDGMFYALFGGTGDSYRHDISYTLEEIQKLYDGSGLQIIHQREADRNVGGLTGRAGRQHELRITAVKKSND